MTIADNPVRLVRQTGTPDDRRARPWGTLKVGQVATLSFRTIHPKCKTEYVKVRITEVDFKTYQGEVLHETLPALMPPEVLRKGSVLTFNPHHVVEMADDYDDPLARLAELTA